MNSKKGAWSHIDPKGNDIPLSFVKTAFKITFREAKDELFTFYVYFL